jgi:integrase
MRVSVTSRKRRRVQRDGRIKFQTRYILNYRDPNTNRRVQRFFETEKEALQARDELVLRAATGVLVPPPKPSHNPTTLEVVEYWLASKRGTARDETIEEYRRYSRYVTGPVPKAPNSRVPRRVEPLGPVLVAELTPADIRRWFLAVAEHVGKYTALRAKSYLKAALELAAVEMGVRPPPMPNIRTNGHKAKKVLLSVEDVGRLIAFCRQHPRGLYVAFPFLTGCRACEQLALRWPDVDFERSVIRIHRSQSRTGVVHEVTKTAAGMRSVPMGPLLREMLLEWRPRCPKSELVFPAARGGRALYLTFNKHIWTPLLREAGVAHVTPHSARHSFISVAQSQGLEVGLVSKIVGHSDPTITLSHYTQAVREADASVAATIEKAFSAS